MRRVLSLCSLVLLNGSGPQSHGLVRLSVTEELRLDATREDLSVVTGVVVNARGQIAVPLRQDWQVRLYDENGRRVASIGRRGSGPGEFRSLTNIGWSGDTLWVFDGAQARTTFVTPEGRLARTVTLQPVGDPLQPGRSDTPGGKYLGFAPVAYLSDGSMIGVARHVPQRADDHDLGSRVLVRSKPPLPPRRLSTLADEHDERWFMTVGKVGRVVPFAWRPQVSVEPHGERIASLSVDSSGAEGGWFTVTSINSGGDTVFSTAVAFRGTPIPSRSVDSALRALAPPPGRPLEGPDLTAQFQSLARKRMPKVYAPVQRVTTGLDYTIWVTLRDSADIRPVLAFSRKGELIGRLDLKPASRLEQASAARIWVTETDDDGLTSIVRYRVVGWPSRG